MVRDTKVRAVVTGAGAIAVWWVLLRVGVPEFISAVAAWSVIHGGHLGSGWLPAFRAKAVWPGVHNLDPESPGWVEWDPPDPAEPPRVVGFALAQPTWDRLEIAAEAAAHQAEVKTPGLMIGRRMRRRAVFACGPWPSDSTLCVRYDMLDAERTEELVDAFAAELRHVRRRVPLWGTIAAGVAFMAMQLLIRSYALT